MKKSIFKEKKFLIFPFALILIILVSTSTINFKQMVLSHEADGNTSSSKIVDPSTANNYKNVLGQITDGGRYAGRVWTDKTVYSDNQTNIDGIAGANVSLNDGEEFLISFSALGSSRILKGQSNAPIDLVLVIDTSSSMGRVTDPSSDISKTIVATNNLLDTFMTLNENNRVSIVLFDDEARILAPLNHYNKNGNTDFITATGEDQYHRVLTLNYLDENDKSQTLSADTSSGTNLQHGLTLGYEQLLNVADNDLTVTENGNIYNRVPALIVLSDGESNRAYNSEDWWHPSEDNYHSGGNSGAGDDSSATSAGVIRSMKPLMTATYLNKAVEMHYNQNPNVYTIGVGLREIRAKIALNPETYVVSDPSNLTGISNSDKAVINQVYNNWINYRNNGSVTITGLNGDGSYTFKTPTTGTNITTLNYVDKYYDISNAGELDDLFSQIVEEISSLAFHPVTDITGTSDELDITYTDPLGEYMDVKDVKALTLFGKMYKPSGSVIKTNNGVKTTTYYFADTDIKHPSYVNEVKVNINNIKVEVIEDETGMVTMKIGVPEGTLPLRLETVTTDNGAVTKYETNSSKVDSLPLRIFYSVGVKDSVKVDTNNDNIPDTIDLNKISKEYKENNTNYDGTINFYSNLYTGETTGDASVNFEPSLQNRYYYFQKNRIIYSNPNGKEGVILDGTNNPGIGYIPVTNINDLNDDEHYYLVIDYYRPLAGFNEKGEYVNYIVERTGAELKNSVTYYNAATNEVSETPGNNFAVATKVGGVRLGRLNRFIENKSENKTGTATQAYAPSYVNETSDDQHFHITLGNNGILKISGGNLTISKTVTGMRGNQNTEFTFNINLTDENNNSITGTFNYAGSKSGSLTFTENGASINLKHGESITFYNLPNNAHYTVTEKEANKDGYKTTSENETGLIPENSEIIANFINSKETGDLTISKTVAGNGGDTNQDFHFTVTFENDNNTYNYDGSKTGTIKSGDTITLKHGESITIKDLQVGTKYTVTEEEANTGGYVTTKEGDTGTISDNTVSTAKFVNTKEVGNLTISKTVAGKGGNVNQNFHFTVTFENDNNTYNYDGSKTGTIKSGDTITLKHGERIQIHGILAGTNYKVTEVEANTNGYVTTKEGDTGTISANDNVTAAFTNTKEVGDLTISKTVTGNSGDTNKEWSFIVTFENDNNTYNYDGSKTGTIKSGDTITLKHGESIQIHDILAGTNYTVTEVEANTNGYVTTKEGDTGTIPANDNVTATFTNEKNVGSLTLSKKVVGNVDDLNVDWNFNINLTDKSNNPITGTFNYTGSKTGTITFSENGASITLKHNQNITINDLPAGTNYTVTEVEANTNGYTTTASGNTGIITDNNVTAAFINTKELGALIISKIVTGNDGDTNKEWNFKVTLTDENNEELTSSYQFTGSKTGTIKSGDTITLKHGENIIIHGIEANTHYEAIELEANQNGYTTTMTNNAGEILAETNKEASFINNKDMPLGNLKISKTVTGVGDTNASWIFKITLTDASGNPLNETFNYTGSKTGTIKSGDTIALKHGENIIIQGIKEGTKYTVQELGANTAGYITTMQNERGSIVGDDTVTANYINHMEAPILNDLTISKTVTGNGGDVNKNWHFIITFDNDKTYNYAGDYTGTIKSGDVITLKHGESITIKDIEKGTLYTIDELEANQDGYKTTMTNNIGIMNESDINASFINNKNVGDLTVSKIVTGNNGQTDRDFHFIINLTDQRGNPMTGEYLYDGSKTGTIKSGDVITLKHGEYIMIHGIEEGTLYSIIELEANQDGYMTIADNNVGEIQTGENTKVTYTNNRNQETSAVSNPRTSDMNPMLYLLIAIMSIVGLLKGLKGAKQN